MLPITPRPLAATPGGSLLGIWIDHAKAVRIPLMIILAGAVMTFWVDQVRELFLLLAIDTPVGSQACVLFASGVLGFAVWHTARTVYRFDIPTNPTLSDPRGECIRVWVPRILGASVPLLMAVGTRAALHSPKLAKFGAPGSSWMIWLFLGESLLLLVFFVFRRRAFADLSNLSAKPAGDPRVERWSQLPRSVVVVYCLVIVANVGAVFLAADMPGRLASTLTCLGVILICASFLTATGTALTIQAARWEFPLLTFLFGLAIFLQWTGMNDNHRVRLYPGMDSDSRPDTTRFKPKQTPLPESFESYAVAWQQAYRSGPVYIVSAEGGGIRAAAWTALVLSQLEHDSGGQFSRHMLMGSGISGGSLGLGLFAAMVNGERSGALRPEDLPQLTEDFNVREFLGPTIETMFLTDFTQRFFPWPVFIDRGERLENGWEAAWKDVCSKRTGASAAASGKASDPLCSLFSQPWGLLWSKEGVPALFLNSTQVASGERFVQHPFASIQEGGDKLDFFNAATSSAGALPASAPLSSVIHNSARFTYVSPAGTLAYDVETPLEMKKHRSATIQLVDGGYFENSGTTTLAELLKFVLQIPGPLAQACSGKEGLHDPACPIRLIHISNDPAVESMRVGDSCPQSNDPAPSHFGEIMAPAMTLLNTRDARGATARAAIRTLFAGGREVTSLEDDSTDDKVYHFRLCAGSYHLPLGWTLSRNAYDELQRQLKGSINGERGPDGEEFATIVKELAAKASGP
jgi:hypothetical protein